MRLPRKGPRALGRLRKNLNVTKRSLWKALLDVARAKRSQSSGAAPEEFKRYKTFSLEGSGWMRRARKGPRGKGERERGRERGREGERERGREGERERGREGERERGREGGREGEREKRRGREAERERGRKGERERGGDGEGERERARKGIKVGEL